MDLWNRGGGFGLGLRTDGRVTVGFLPLPILDLVGHPVVVSNHGCKQVVFELRLAQGPAREPQGPPTDVTFVPGEPWPRSMPAPRHRRPTPQRPRRVLQVRRRRGADIDDLGTERAHRVLRVTCKGGKTATIPMAPRTAKGVDIYVGDRTSGPIFATSTGKRWQRSEAWRTLRRLARGAVPEKTGTLPSRPPACLL